MTEQFQSAAPAADAAAHLGNELRRLRESQNLSIGEVADRLKLPVRQVEALEQANYQGLPEAVFVRGFLRSYGRFVGMNENSLNDSLEQIFPTTKVSRNLVSTSATPPREGSKFPTWLLAAAAAVLIGGGIYAWQSKSNSNTEQQETAIDLMAAKASAASNLDNLNTTVQAMKASESATPVAVSGASAPAVAGEMIIRPRYRTMLTVRNAAGEVLMNQIVAGRSEHRFSNGAPFEVRVGYADRSTIEFNGETILLDSKRQGHTAVLTVGNAQ